MVQLETAPSPKDTAFRPTIDADAHVIETDHTWDFMEPSESNTARSRWLPSTTRVGEPSG